MFKQLVCESCGKIWQVDYPSTLLDVKVESCQECKKFKFKLEPKANKSNIPTKR